jgi:hypothetical protein
MKIALQRAEKLAVWDEQNIWREPILEKNSKFQKIASILFL